MTSFKYRLQPLADLKLERRDQAQRDLALRVAELAAEQKALEDMRSKRVRMEELLAASRSGLLAGAEGASGLAVIQRTDYLRGLATDLEAAKDAEFSQRFRVREFEGQVVKARRLFADCSREVEVLDKHRERLEKRFLRENEKRGAAEQDEIGSTMFNRGRQTNESFR
jgi:flagellar export protein FliJ